MLMKCFILSILTFVVMSLDLQEVDREWNNFKVNYNRVFTTREEEQYRYTVFTQNYKTIYFHNRAANRGNYTYWLGINKFADMTSVEFKRSYASLKLSLTDSRRNAGKTRVKSWDTLPLPKETDWRDYNCVTEVKDQRNCCSCYAFAAAGAIESHYCLTFNYLQPLSEQNIVDCSQSVGNNGCDNGNPFDALKYAMQKGLDTEVSYPYQGKEGKCNQSQENLGSWVNDIESTWPHGNVGSLEKAVAFEGPVSVCIDTDDADDTFQLYSHGVYNNPNCNDEVEDLDHALLLVGYGIDQGQPYWLMKNSYGVGWGEDGYLRMAKKVNENSCGIATSAWYPIMKNL